MSSPRTLVMSRKYFFSMGLGPTEASTSRLGAGVNLCLEVFLKGRINPSTGLIVNLSRIDPLAHKMLEHFDHKNAGFDIPELSDSENILEDLIQLCWQKLEKYLGELPVQLELLKLIHPDYEISYQPFKS